MGSVFRIALSALVRRHQIVFVKCILDLHLIPVFSLEPLDYLPLILYRGKPVKIQGRVFEF